MKEENLRKKRKKEGSKVKKKEKKGSDNFCYHETKNRNFQLTKILYRRIEYPLNGSLLPNDSVGVFRSVSYE